MRRLAIRAILPLGEAQAWLARTRSETESEWTRFWTLALWAFARPAFLLGFVLVVPREER